MNCSFVKFRIDAGDGDQSILGRSFLAKEVRELWFSGKINGKDAILLAPLERVMQGKIFAITAKSSIDLHKCIKQNPGPLIVLYELLGFDGEIPKFRAVGISGVDIISD